MLFHNTSKNGVPVLRRRYTAHRKRKLMICAAIMVSLASVIYLAIAASEDTQTPKRAIPLEPYLETSLPDTFLEEPVLTPAPTPISLGEFTLTAYCPCVKCCEIWSASHPSRIGTDYIQKTASGTIPKAGRTIGVGPKIISFGTEVDINGHIYTAEDKGGGVKGNHIDIFFDTHSEAVAFGRQTAEVYTKDN